MIKPDLFTQGIILARPRNDGGSSRNTNNQWEVLAIRRCNRTDVELPKGRLERNETSQGLHHKSEEQFFFARILSQAFEVY